MKRDYLSAAHKHLMTYEDIDLAHFELVTEFQFHHKRKWRFDIAHPRCKVAMELDGGLFRYGGHNRGKQIKKDHEKSNTAQIMGWIVLRATPQEWDSGEAMRTFRAAIESRTSAPQQKLEVA